MPDALEQARFHLEGTQDCLDRIGDLDAGHRAQAGQLAALIAIAEQIDKQNESLALIASRVDEIGSVLLNAAGPDGAIKVAQ